MQITLRDKFCISDNDREQVKHSGRNNSPEARGSATPRTLVNLDNHSVQRIGISEGRAAECELLNERVKGELRGGLAEGGTEALSEGGRGDLTGNARIGLDP